MYGWTDTRLCVHTGTKIYFLCASVSERLVVALKGVQVGFESQGAGVSQVGGAVQVQAREDLHVSDPGCVELQQVLHPL